MCIRDRFIGYLRNIAYLIPGIGIGGLIGLVIEPISEALEKLFNKVDAYKRSQQAIIDINTETKKSTAAQISEVKNLYEITQDITQQTDDRVDASKRLLDIVKEHN